MKRQIETERLDITSSDVKPVINYDGKIIKDYYISSKTLKVYKDLGDGEFKVCSSYLNICKSGASNWKYGYYKVRVNGGLYNLHWLLARAFVPGYKIGLCVDHINNDSTDNNISNLQWVTRSENTKKFWNSLSDKEMAEYKAKYSQGLRRAHANGHYKEHLNLLHGKE